MAEYLVANFTVINPEGYKTYLKTVVPTLKAYGAEILVAEYQSEPLEGEPGEITMVFKFASKEMLYGWYNSPEYQKIVHLRADSTKGIAVSAGEFDLAKNLRLLETM
jgi:uncharacterized protein (DUF1330 family)